MDDARNSLEQITSAYRSRADYKTEVQQVARQTVSEMNARIDEMIHDLESMRLELVLKVEHAAQTILAKADQRAVVRARVKVMRDATRFRYTTRRIVNEGTLPHLLAQKHSGDKECALFREVAEHNFEEQYIEPDLLLKRYFLDQLAELRDCVSALRCNADQLVLDARVVQSFDSRCESGCQTDEMGLMLRKFLYHYYIWPDQV